MDRRQFLAVAGAVALAGCGSDGGDGEGDGGEDEDPLENAPTVQEMDEKEFDASGEFEIVDVDHPKQVKVGEGHTIGITVKNVGEEKRVVLWNPERKFADADGWQKVEVVGPEIKPGETGTVETMGRISYERAGEVQYRVPDHDVTWSYEVEPVDIDVWIESTSLVEIEKPYESDPVPVAEIVLSNRGDDLTDRFSLTVDWFDSDGNDIVSRDSMAPPLASGERASLRIDPTTEMRDGYDRIETFDVTLGTVEPLFSTDPEGIVVVDEQLLTSESDTRLRVTVRNDRDSEAEWVTVFGKVTDSAGTVIGWASGPGPWADTGFPAGETVQLDLEPNTGGRDDAVAGHEVLVVEESHW